MEMCSLPLSASSAVMRPDSCAVRADTSHHLPAGGGLEREDPVAAPYPSQPGSIAARALSTGRNRLALTSFLLALAGPVCFVLLVTRMFNYLLFLVGAGELAKALVVVLDLVGLLASIEAIVTGSLAMRRAKQYPPSRRGRAGLWPAW